MNDRPGLPSAADLDAVAEEERLKNNPQLQYRPSRTMELLTPILGGTGTVVYEVTFTPFWGWLLHWTGNLNRWLSYHANKRASYRVARY